MKNALILLAGGVGKRSENPTPKQFIKFGNFNIIEYFLTYLDSKIFSNIVIVANKNNQKKYLNLINKQYPQHKIIFSQSGKVRQISSLNALKRLKKINPKNVVIHDAARPLVSNKLMKRVLKSLETNVACVPYITHNDFIKIKSKENINLKNNQILYIQTPQGFRYKEILKAHSKSKEIDVKDDSTLIEELGIKVSLIKGEKANFKLTYKEDLNLFNTNKIREYRHGIGYDIHRINFKSKNKLILCGVKISHPPLIGHSDADVGYHAICDSILGAMSLEDIGTHFKNTDKKWKNANSKIFLDYCYRLLKERNYRVINLDINFICETPNISKLSNKMKKNISSLLKIKISKISIKATTNEKIGLIGKAEGIAAESIIQISND